MTAPAQAREVAGQFELGGPVDAVVPLPGGHINDSYQVDALVPGSEEPLRYLLQRLNPQVFPRADLVMENIANVTRHVAARLRAAGIADWRRRTLVLVPARDGADWVTTPEGACWRMFPLIGGAYMREHVRGEGDARAAGRGFGEFLQLVADYPGPRLHQTLPGFHDALARFEILESAVRRDPCHRANDARHEIVALMSLRGLVDLLPPLLVTGEVPTRVVHNDAKLANVLLDARTDEPLCVVDLDTVMPGLVLHDFGDLVRSATSPTAEDEEDLTRVGVRLPLFQALARGFLETAGAVLSEPERKLLVHGGQLLTLEQAVRFLTDHLEGDRYYRISRPDHNLQRCRTQLKLFATVTAAKPELDDFIAGIR